MGPKLCCVSGKDGRQAGVEHRKPEGRIRRNYELDVDRDKLVGKLKMQFECEKIPYSLSRTKAVLVLYQKQG